MPTRTSGIEKNAARVAIATSQQVTKPGAAADRAAFDHGDSRLGQAVEDREHVAQRIFGGLRRLGRRARPARRKVGAGAEMLAGAAQDDDPHAVVRAPAP